MTVTETVCDRCGARKGKTNHWFKVEIDMRDKDWFTVTKNNGKSQVGDDYCSDNCVMIALSEFLNSKKEEIEVDEMIETIEEQLPQ